MDRILNTLDQPTWIIVPLMVIGIVVLSVIMNLDMIISFLSIYLLEKFLKIRKRDIPEE